MLFAIGIVFLPLTSSIFSNFFDKGYIFSRIIGIAVLSYIVFLLGVLRLFPFQTSTVIFVGVILFIINLFIAKKTKFLSKLNLKTNWKIFLFEELIFLTTLFFWSFIRSHQPDIHGLEKYMDFGFVNSILRSNYFPPKDMWFASFPINYYYFGHLITAVLTKLSGIPSSIAFNLMIATLFSLTFSASLSIGFNLVGLLNNKRGVAGAGDPHRVPAGSRQMAETEDIGWGKSPTGPRLIAGLLSAFLVTFAGNLHGIYAFFRPYFNENPIPFWQLPFSLNTFPNSYWYPNATRFIHNTIHEFPIYSFVVSDLHGHVLDIPFVLLTIVVLLSLVSKWKLEIVPSALLRMKLEIPLISFLLAVMYMTSAWDGLIYLLLTAIVIFLIQLKSANKKYILHTTYYILLVLVGFFLFSLPFSLNFKPFASGIGILCAPKFLTNIGRLGPFLFEPNHCQRSPLWQLLILYGFFYFWVAVFIASFISKIKSKSKNIQTGDIFIVALIILSTILIIIPELIYVKDIYPAHYRANTMFKLVYESFIMLSIASGYIIIRLISNSKFQISNLPLVTVGIIGLFLISIYPYFAINSYYGNLNKYYGLDGTSYLKILYPQDYQAIQWINRNIKGQPVILEAQGDSYTDYARVSSNTGLPTVLGWTVHEWLWRGTYDIPTPRINDVRTLYETNSLDIASQLINEYKISLVFIGNLEYQKYPKLNEEKFKKLGNLVYQYGQTKIYKINSKVF